MVGGGEAGSLSEAAVPVDGDGGLLDADLLLERQADALQLPLPPLALLQLVLELLHGGLQLGHLLYQPVRRLVAAQLDVGPLVPVGQPSARYLVRRVLLPYSVLQITDHSLDLCDLVDGLLEVGLELPGGLLRLGHAVGEALLHAVRLLPQVLAGVGEGAADDASQPDTRLALLLRQPGVCYVVILSTFILMKSQG